MFSFSPLWKTSWLTVVCNTALKMLILFQLIGNDVKESLVLLVYILHGKSNTSETVL